MLRLKHLLLSAALIPLVALQAKDEFTAAEQQQISIETPGLFSQSDAFTIDFAGLRESDYCFPLPVGKATIVKDYNIEISTTKGDAVKAMFAGMVRLSRNHPTFGNVIVVRHDNGLETVYCRNAQNLVKVGDRVKAGQTIAIVGGEGNRYACLFAIMVNGNRINPEMILNVNNHRLLKQSILCRKSSSWRVEMSVVRPEKSGDKEMAQGESKVGTDSFNPFAGNNKFTLNLADLNPGEWCYPLPEAKVISQYGRRGGRRHTGVDLKTKANDAILAAFDGVVTHSGPFYGYGNLIRIKHTNGIETYYSHNSKNLVKVGDRVKAGQKIGLTGRTGRASTEHLHFECRINGQPFNPACIFDHANNSVMMQAVTFTKRGGSVNVTTEKNYMAKGR
jgi:murein DD-endopeptidase MepM/ murein hydrolase activator NlpD